MTFREKCVIAKNNLPLVDLVVHQPEGKRKLGLLAGKFVVPDDFCDEDADVNAMFYGEEDGCSESISHTAECSQISRSLR